MKSKFRVLLYLVVLIVILTGCRGKSKDKSISYDLSDIYYKTSLVVESTYEILSDSVLKEKNKEAIHRLKLALIDSNNQTTDDIVFINLTDTVYTDLIGDSSTTAVRLSSYSVDFIVPLKKSDPNRSNFDTYEYTYEKISYAVDYASIESQALDFLDRINLWFTASLLDEYPTRVSSYGVSRLNKFFSSDMIRGTTEKLDNVLKEYSRYSEIE